MIRDASRSERKLLDAGRAVLAESGLGGLRLRAVARRAGLNVGLFPYHFGTKRAFLRLLLQETYDEFFARLSRESAGDGPADRRLRRALVTFGRFTRDQRRLFVALLAEALQGDREVISYLEANVPRHAGLIGRLIAEGQRARAFKALPAPVAVSFALGAMGAPNVMITALERCGGSAARRHLASWSEEFLSDRALERRADLVLAALRS